MISVLARRGVSEGPFSDRYFSLKLCTSISEYGFSEPIFLALSRAFAPAKFESLSLDQTPTLTQARRLLPQVAVPMRKSVDRLTHYHPQGILAVEISGGR